MPEPIPHCKFFLANSYFFPVFYPTENSWERFELANALNFRHETADRAELYRGRVRRQIAESVEKFYVFRFFSCVGVFVSYNCHCTLGGPCSARIPQKFFLPLGSRESGVVFTVLTVLTVGELFRRARKPRRQHSKRYVQKFYSRSIGGFNVSREIPAVVPLAPSAFAARLTPNLGAFVFALLFVDRRRAVRVRRPPLPQTRAYPFPDKRRRFLGVLNQY